MFESNELLITFDRGVMTRSQPYVAQLSPDRIDIKTTKSGQTQLSAVIQGTSPYTTFVLIHEHDIIQTKCSCDEGAHCKHAAALITAALQHQLLPASAINHEPSLTPTSHWLNQLALTNPTKIKPHKNEDFDKPSSFIYVLQPFALYAPRELTIVVQKIQRLKNGSISSAAAKNWTDFYSVASNDTLSDTDKYLMNMLHTQQRTNNVPMAFGRQMMNGIAMSALQELTETGRFYWRSHKEKNISWHDEPYRLNFETQPNDDGTTDLIPLWCNEQGEALDLEPDQLYLIPSEPLTYLDSQRGLIGLLETQYPSETILPLLQTPTVSSSFAAELKQQITQKNNATNVQLPKYFGPAQPILITQSNPLNHRTMDDAPQGFAKIAFDYEGGTVHYAQSGEVFQGSINGVKVLQHRDRATELAAVQLLHQSIPSLLPASITGMVCAPLTLWFDALTTEDYFKKLGWQIRHAPSSPLNIHRASAPNIALTEHIETGNDWFGLGMHVQANGKRYNLSELLGSLVEIQPELLDSQEMQTLSDATFLFVSAFDGAKIALRVGEIRPVLMHLTDLFNAPAHDGELKLDRYDAMRLLRLQHTLGLAYSGSGQLQKLIDVFRRGHEQQLKAPEGFNGVLRPYQEKGLAWLQFLRESEHGGILADDMGLGKTAQALAHILVEKNAGRLSQPALIVAPTSLMHNWRVEAARFTPSLNVLVLQGMDRTQHFEHLDQYDIILTTYPLLPRDEETLLTHEYAMVILDEAQNIKNPIAKAARVARKLNTRHRLCLTGTPMENHLGELWSLYHFLMPGFLGSQESFNRRFRHPIEKHADTLAKKSLVDRTTPFMLRRRKLEVASELPPKTTIVVHIDMSSAQQKLYEAIRAAMQTKVQMQIAQKGFRRSHMDILDALLKLRQVCCHPSLLKMSSVNKNIESAKLTALMEMSSEMVAEGRRILIFSQFTSMLSLIEAELQSNQIDYVKLTGQTKNRAEVIDAFQTGNIPIFLISLKAGGVGLNLTAADTVIHYDPWWNPAAEEQASDRAWRIGQDKPVSVYKLIMAGSIEERIIEMQQRKADLSNSILSNDGEQAVKFNEEDLLNLLAPLHLN